MAIVYNIIAQDVNWSEGKVGEGHIYRGLRMGLVNEAQSPSYEPIDPDERRWHQFSNGERIFDFSGNAFIWVFDNVQGDEKGIIERQFAEDSISIVPIYNRPVRGVDWHIAAGDDRSGHAIVRGANWCSGRGDWFGLYINFPDYIGTDIGFRCTKTLT